MEITNQIKVAADIVWIRLNVNSGEMFLPKLRRRLRMKRALFNQAIGWLANEGLISIKQNVWGEKIRLIN
ncbi:MAG: winged helix-turn-helix domain-containing protein [Candidatus Scalindua sp.]|nr:winged helix-turn-helix domain-containing protein [Candidatus Scalindua sp.]